MKVACFSVAAMDFFPQKNQHFAGGNSLNQALRFRQLGHEAVFFGALGRDEAGDSILALLKSRGVDTRCCYQLPGRTASNQIVNDAAGERFGVAGAWDGGVYGAFKLSASDWQQVCRCDIWATHANGINYPEALARKAEAHFLAVDFLDASETMEQLEPSLNVADIVYVGGEAAMAEQLCEVSRRHAGLIVLTLGAGGSLAFQRGQIWKQHALPIDPVVDCTGCGDAFQAAFTAHYYQHRDIPAALQAGAELGRKAASGYGGVTGC